MKKFAAKQELVPQLLDLHPDAGNGFAGGVPHGDQAVALAVLLDAGVGGFEQGLIGGSCAALSGERRPPCEGRRADRGQLEKGAALDREGRVGHGREHESWLARCQVFTLPSRLNSAYIAPDAPPQPFQVPPPMRNPPIDPRLFVANRERLRALLVPNSARGGERQRHAAHQRRRHACCCSPNSDLFYLTGVRAGGEPSCCSTRTRTTRSCARSCSCASRTSCSRPGRGTS